MLSLNLFRLINSSRGICRASNGCEESNGQTQRRRSLTPLGPLIDLFDTSDYQEPKCWTWRLSQKSA